MGNGKLVIIIISLLPNIVSAQMSLPCLNYETQEQLEGFYGQMNTNCVKIDFGQWWGSVSDEHSRSFEVNEGAINPGTAESGGIVIQPGENDASGFQMTLRQTNNAQEMEGAWFEPTTGYEVPLYEKVEWGVKLPQQVQIAIDNWISNDQNGTALAPAINPFDPEQLDMYAEVWQPGAASYQPVFGFYYRDYRRIWRDNNPNNLPDMDDPDNWFRQELPTEYDFRLRWSPTIEGWHAVKIKMHVPNLGDWEAVSFNFKAVWNDPRQSFISVTPNKKYFQTNDGNIFFPVGENLFPAKAECYHPIQNTLFDNETLDCEKCYPEGENSLLCGLDAFSEGIPLDWRGSFWRGEQSDMERNTEHMATYLVQKQYIQILKNKGGTCVRTMPTGISYEFEFEKLNNYYERSFMAWELDDLFNFGHSIDLKIEFCMTVHFPFGNTYSGHWDWTNFEDPEALWPQYIGNCYFEESEKTNCDSEPISFFREENAKKYYKHKLRYFVARYGWCSDILDLELVSEINNVGARGENTFEAEPWLQAQLGPNLSYVASRQSRDIIGQWQIEMANYIKNDLKHTRHLIAADYAGQPMWSEDINEIDAHCSDEFFDEAWGDPAIDIIAFSSYDIAALDRFQKLSDNGEPNKTEWHKMICCEDSDQLPCVGETAMDWGVPKPVIHAECSSSPLEEDMTGREKELWCHAFAGYASSGMHWGPMYPMPHWDKFGKVAQFMNEQVFTMGGFASSEAWIQGYSLQNNDNESQLAEAVYLKHSVLNNEKAVGILMNRTWNFATTTSLPPRFEGTTAGANYEVYKGTLEAAGLVPFVNLTFDQDDALRLDGMGFCNKFEIKYFDPYTLQLISTAEDKTSLFNDVLKLKDHPTLTFERPYVLFKIERLDDCTGIFGMAENNDINAIQTTSNDQRTVDTNVTVDQTSLLIEASNTTDEINKCSVSPNPSENIVRVNCDKPWLSIELLDGLSRKLPFYTMASSEIDLSTLPKGQYYLRITFDNVVETFKVIKL